MGEREWLIGYEIWTGPWGWKRTAVQCFSEDEATTVWRELTSIGDLGEGKIKTLKIMERTFSPWRDVTARFEDRYLSHPGRMMREWTTEERDEPDQEGPVGTAGG